MGGDVPSRAPAEPRDAYLVGPPLIDVRVFIRGISLKAPVTRADADLGRTIGAETRKNMGAKLLGGAGVVAAIVFVGLQVFLYVGGISYRKECVNGRRQIAKSWSFTWFAPIPYLFRPDDPGCVVHTGTRVALDAAGIAKFEDTTATAIADRAVQHGNPDADDAYWVKLRGAVTDYGNRNEKVADVSEALRSVNTLLGQLAEFSPPARYADAHAGLVAAVRQVKEHGEDLRVAADAKDTEAFNRARRTIAPDATRVQHAMEQLNLAHTSGG
jgi:hypothetical protein